VQNPDEAIEQYQLAKKDRTMNSEQEKLFDAIADWKSNDEWKFADKEAAWKFFFQAGVASRDAEVAELQKAIDENWVTHQQIVAASKERDLYAVVTGRVK